MKKYLIILFNTLSIYLITSCDLFKPSKETSYSNMPLKKEKLKNKDYETNKKSQEDKNYFLSKNELEKENLEVEAKEDIPLIGIQKTKTDGVFKHERQYYDFSKTSWIFRVKKDDDTGSIIFTIIDNEKGLDTSNQHNISSNIGVAMIISDDKSGNSNNFSKIKNAMTNGGSFDVILNISASNEFTMTVVKEENENDYVFIDTKITTGEKDDKGNLAKDNYKNLKNEEVSFAINIEKFKEEFEKIE